MSNPIPRDLEQEMINWATRPIRKPLVIRGARQVGKTSLIQSFADSRFKNKVYCNFERDQRLASLFEGTISPEVIIQNLSAYFGIDLSVGDSVIIFDEIQACPNAVTSLKYFAEELPQMHVIAAGSLLGVSMALSGSFPVGKVESLILYPLSFAEFARALPGEQMLWKLVEEKMDLTPLPLAIHERLLELVRRYVYCGGMPEVTSALVASVPLSELRALQIEILENYRADFAKHAPVGELGRILAVWQAVPAFLGKENKKFIFADLEENARAINFAAAIQWLTTAGLIYQCNRVREPAMPLLSAADFRSFKLYPHDVGLLGAAMNVSSQLLVEKLESLHHLYRGSLVESFVAGQLKMELTNRTSNRALYYWRSENSAEVDFIVQRDTDVVPIEVKSGTNLKAKSLTSYIARYSPKSAIRVSAQNFNVSGNIINIPLYAIGLFEHFLLLRDGS